MIRKFLRAIFRIDKNDDKLLNDARAFYNTLKTPEAAVYVTILPADMTAAEGNVATAETALVTSKTGAEGTADAKNLAMGVVVTDVRGFVRDVQEAADNAPDEENAITIIHTCGLDIPKKGIKTKPDFAVENDSTGNGSVIFTFKAAKQGLTASYETQVSTDGINFVTIKASPEYRCNYLHGKAQGTKLYFRGRIVLTAKKGGEQKWSNIVVIFTA